MCCSEQTYSFKGCVFLRKSKFGCLIPKTNFEFLFYRDLIIRYLSDHERKQCIHFPPNGFFGLLTTPVSPDQYRYTLTKLAILLTTSVTSQLNSYAASVTDSVRKAPEAQLINRRDEARQWHIWLLFTHSLPIIVTSVFFSTFFFPLSPWGRFALQTKIGQFF